MDDRPNENKNRKKTIPTEPVLDVEHLGLKFNPELEVVAAAAALEEDIDVVLEWAGNPKLLTYIKKKSNSRKL